MNDSFQLRICAAVSVFVLLVASALSQEPAAELRQSGGATQILVAGAAGPVVVHETKAVVPDATVRTVVGSPLIAVTWNEIDPRQGTSAAFYAISIDGRRFLDPAPTSYDLLLRYRRFDPLVSGEPPIPAAIAATGSSRIWIVQYWTQALDEYRGVVAALGGSIHRFLANHADVVEADSATIEILRAQPFVRWVGPFHPAYKLEEQILDEIAGAAPPPGERSMNILTMRRGAAGHEPVLAGVAAIGGSVEADSPETHLITARLSLAQITQLARLDDVQWIDRWGPPEDDMDIARALHGADYVEAQGGYVGTGVRVEVLDGGCDTAHPDLQNYLLHGQNSASSHGTCTAGIVCGSGSGNAAARGAMPAATLIIGDYGFMSNRYNHTAELQNQALAYKCVLQSNSWGSTLTTQYTSISQDMDLILFDFQRISILQSQSNNGDQNSRPEAWAKNIISVGGIRHYNTAATTDDAWASGASIGPGADGRLKPDVASFYDNVHCTDRVGTAGYSSTNYYTSFSGTSSATPICAGHLGLMYEMWSNGAFNNPTPGATVFDNRPNNTTMKALLINTATQWPFSGAGADLTRTHQGWGHPDLMTAWDLRNSMYIVDESDVLTNLGSTVHSVTVAPGATFKATLVYRDNPGTTSSTLHRINNLDLKVTSPSGTIYWGNNGLAAGNWSTSGGSANTVDNVENVFVQVPQPGTWLVEVIAAELNQDNHVETPGVDADYALVVSGVTPGPPPPPSANFSANPLSGTAPLTVNFSDLSTGGATAWAWDFGDGASDTVANPSHQYTTPGTYTVSLTTTWASGSDNETKTGYITVNAPPSITSLAPQSVAAFQGGVVTVTGTDLGGATQVNVGGAILTSPGGFTVVGPTTITFTAPNAIALGPVAVTVTTPIGTSGPATLTYVETFPAKIVAPAFVITGSLANWTIAAGANDTGALIVSTSNTTFDYGTPYQILLNYYLVGTTVCSPIGIGTISTSIPPGFSGITFYSQGAGIDEITGNFSVSAIASTLILF